MKRIFLIGDSIRHGLATEESRKLGYGYHVKQKLEGVAEVYAPDDNSRFLQYTLRYLHEWAASVPTQETIDAVHWNNGLWDVLRLFGDEPFTPIEIYKEYLVRVNKRIKFLFPNAKIIFALSTPVSEEMATKDFYRKNNDIMEYNNAAIEILTPLGVAINDLYTPALSLRENAKHDWVHYNEEGAKVLADIVIDKIYEEKIK